MNLPSKTPAEHRTGVRRGHFKQTRVGILARAEGDNARRSTGPRRPEQHIRSRGVDRDQGSSAALEPLEDFGFGLGDPVQASKVLKMCRRNACHQGDIRTHEVNERTDLACTVHTELEHGRGSGGRHPCQTQRNAYRVVMARRAGMYGSQRGQRGSNQLFGAGLADAPGDRHHL